MAPSAKIESVCPPFIRAPSAHDSRRTGKRQRLAVDDRDVERKRIEAFHATQVDPITLLPVLASNGTVRIDAADPTEIVAHDFVIPEVHSQFTLIAVRREVGVPNVGWRQHRTPADTQRAIAAYARRNLGAAERKAHAFAVTVSVVLHDLTSKEQWHLLTPVWLTRSPPIKPQTETAPPQAPSPRAPSPKASADQQTPKPPPPPRPPPPPQRTPHSTQTAPQSTASKRPSTPPQSDTPYSSPPTQLRYAPPQNL